MASSRPQVNPHTDNKEKIEFTRATKTRRNQTTNNKPRTPRKTTKDAVNNKSETATTRYTTAAIEASSRQDKQSTKPPRPPRAPQRQDAPSWRSKTTNPTSTAGRGPPTRRLQQGRPQDRANMDGRDTPVETQALTIYNGQWEGTQKAMARQGKLLMQAIITARKGAQKQDPPAPKPALGGPRGVRKTPRHPRGAQRLKDTRTRRFVSTA